VVFYFLSMAGHVHAREPFHMLGKARLCMHALHENDQRGPASNVYKEAYNFRHRIHRPRKRPKIKEVVYQQLTQLGRTDSAVGKPLIYYCENSSSYSGRGAWSIYSMSLFTIQLLKKLLLLSCPPLWSSKSNPR